MIDSVITEPPTISPIDVGDNEFVDEPVDEIVKAAARGETGGASTGSLIIRIR